MLPFLKWAGGKRWFVEKHISLIPTSYDRYIEPFLGSGAVFFFIEPLSAIINDINRDLIETYQTMAWEWEKIYDLLKMYDQKHCQEFYYKIRRMHPRLTYTKAARFIYLNRTCWNGLYRVNQKGNFNVPIGTKKRVLLETDNFFMTSQLLQKTTICNRDFESIIDQARARDFIFIDPPYTIKHNNNGFVKYNEKMFSWEDQVRLSDAIKKAHSRGASFLMTNANHQCIRDLYQEFSWISFSRSSVIAADPNNRGAYSELLITNIDLKNITR